MNMKQTLKRNASNILGITAAILLIVFPLLGAPPHWTLYIFLFFFYWALANIWNLLAGYCGLISLCQPAFIGIGGYTLVLFTWNGLPFYYGIIVGGLIAAAFAALITIPTFRLKGIFFSIGTLIIPEIMKIVFLLWKPVDIPGYGGGAGYMIKGVSQLSNNQMYWMALVVGLGSYVLVKAILKSKLGLGLAAIRDNDTAAASSGVNVFRIKFYVFVIGALVTGIAGAIYYVSKGFIQPETSFNLNWTVQIMIATVIGGLGTIKGPIVGTIIAVILQFVLARSPGISLLIQGSILIIILLIAPHGIVGFIQDIKNRQFFSRFTKRLHIT
jgi:branched-chain amino acid transport system permease protein